MTLFYYLCGKYEKPYGDKYEIMYANKYEYGNAE